MTEPVAGEDDEKVAQRIVTGFVEVPDHDDDWLACEIRDALASRGEAWRKWLCDEFDIDPAFTDELVRAELLEQWAVMKADYGYLRRTVPKEVEAARLAGLKRAIAIMSDVGYPNGCGAYSVCIDSFEDAVVAAILAELDGGKQKCQPDY